MIIKSIIALALYASAVRAGPVSGASSAKSQAASSVVAVPSTAIVSSLAATSTGDPNGIRRCRAPPRASGQQLPLSSHAGVATEAASSAKTSQVKPTGATGHINKRSQAPVSSQAAKTTAPPSHQSGGVSHKFGSNPMLPWWTDCDCIEDDDTAGYKGEDFSSVKQSSIRTGAKATNTVGPTGGSSRAILPRATDGPPSSAAAVPTLKSSVAPRISSKVSSAPIVVPTGGLSSIVPFLPRCAPRSDASAVKSVTGIQTRAKSSATAAATKQARGGPLDTLL